MTTTEIKLQTSAVDDRENNLYPEQSFFAFMESVIQHLKSVGNCPQ